MATNQSFLPEDYLDKKIAYRTNLIFISLFAVVLVVVVTTFFVSDRQSKQVRDDLTAVNRSLEEKRSQLEQLESLNQRKDQMKRKANVTGTLRDRVPKSSVFAELINAMPATLSLTDLDLDTKVLKDAPAPKTAMQRERLRQQATGQPEVTVVPTAVELTLAGLAPTDVEVSQYIGALNIHPMFEDVTLDFVESMQVDEVDMRKFRIALTLDSRFDVSQLEPTRVQRGLKLDPMGDTLQINADGEMVKPTETLGSVSTEPE